ncbi:MAG: hypothetical protein K1X56_01415 [Flavobacteriales bacterium]|nr:hypothetical protein [Flavobacteriales bacterium]
MKKFFMITGLLMMTAMMITSCSKEKQLERRMFKKGGDWNVASLRSIEYEDGVLLYDDNYTNCGTFHFGKDGKGNYTINVAGMTDSGNFTWSNDETKITIDADVYTVVKNEKDAVTIKYTETYYDSGFQYNYEETIALERK